MRDNPGLDDGEIVPMSADNAQRPSARPPAAQRQGTGAQGDPDAGRHQRQRRHLRRLGHGPGRPGRLGDPGAPSSAAAWPPSPSTSSSSSSRCGWATSCPSIAGVTRIGRTSITVQVEVYRRALPRAGPVRQGDRSVAHLRGHRRQRQAAADRRRLSAAPATAPHRRTDATPHERPPDPPDALVPALEHKTLLWLVVGFTVAFACGAVAADRRGAVGAVPGHRVLADAPALPPRWSARPSLAAFLTLLSIVLIVILPLALVSASVVQEASLLFQKIKLGRDAARPVPAARPGRAAGLGAARSCSASA